MTTVLIILTTIGVTLIIADVIEKIIARAKEREKIKTIVKDLETLSQSD